MSEVLEFETDTILLIEDKWPIPKKGAEQKGGL
jgi:hypothetical protein